MKQFFITAGFIVAAIVSFAQKPEIYSPSGIAINGYDVVAFYKEAKAVKGSDAFSYQWKNADWLFSTQQNLDSFKLSPEKYEPAYGGYCAYGTSRGYKAPTIADTWTIINQKLYFNYNMKVKELWDKDRNMYIDSANIKWATIKNL
jgi:hypothetical protein